MSLEPLSSIIIMKIKASQCTFVASIAFGLLIATIQKMVFDIFCTAMAGGTGPLPEVTELALRIQAIGWLILIMGTLCLVLIHKFVRTEEWRTILYLTYVAGWLMISLFSHYAFAIGLESRLVR